MTISGSLRKSTRPRGALGLFSAVAFGLAVTATPASAGLKVHGSADAVRIEAQGASIETILTALGDSFGLRLKSSVNLDKQLTGTYEGSLQRVVARLLDGHNFILKTDKGQAEVIVFGTRNVGATAAPAAAASTPAAVAAPRAAAQPAPPSPDYRMADVSPKTGESSPALMPVPDTSVPMPGGLSTAPSSIAPPQPKPSTVPPPTPVPSTASPPLPTGQGTAVVPPPDPMPSNPKTGPQPSSQ